MKIAPMFELESSFPKCNSWLGRFVTVGDGRLTFMIIDSWLAKFSESMFNTRGHHET